MELLQHLFVLAHLLGMAAIIGSALFVARGTVTPALVWGARAQLVPVSSWSGSPRPRTTR